MTVGEKIQMYRKQLNLSQEELGQKLLVSRQTISLWEKDQTAPTIDNLIRLKELFGVSVDEILNLESDTNAEILPNETYNFNFTKDELSKIHRLQNKSVYKKPIISILLYILLLVFFIETSTPEIIIGLVFGMFFFSLVSHIKMIRTYNKLWKSSIERICKSNYEYKVFEDYININIYRENKIMRSSKCFFSDIEQIQILGNWLFLEFGGQRFVLRKSELKENSSFFSYIYKNPKKTVQKPTSNGFKVLSSILFWLSLAAIFLALALVGAVSEKNNLFIENMWLFFLLTPIPIASIVLGYILKSKGYKYKKNIIVGIIMTALLCIYGSFSFVFSDIYNHSDAPIIKTEQTLGIDIPNHKQINTQDFTKASQSFSRGYIYYRSDIYFEDISVENFEKHIETDEKWLSAIPNDLIGITSPFVSSSYYDYVLIYNTDTSEYNTLPQNSGTFNFISVHYNLEENEMAITEYDIDYVK